MYDINYFIRKFTNTRDDRWCTYVLYDNRGNTCANGWCGVRTGPGQTFILTEESKALALIFKPLADGWINDNSSLGPEYSNIAGYINNGDDKRYQQNTPKERILAALHDIKVKGEGKQPSWQKTVYVAVHHAVVEEAEATLEMMS